jgi:hypothetical protein
MGEKYFCPLISGEGKTEEEWGANSGDPVMDIIRFVREKRKGDCICFPEIVDFKG